VRGRLLWVQLSAASTTATVEQAFDHLRLLRSRAARVRVCRAAPRRTRCGGNRIVRWLYSEGTSRSLTWINRGIRLRFPLRCELSFEEPHCFLHHAIEEPGGAVAEPDAYTRIAIFPIGFR
jgi:hypothetical protein